MTESGVDEDATFVPRPALYGDRFLYDAELIEIAIGQDDGVFGHDSAMRRTWTPGDASRRRRVQFGEHVSRGVLVKPQRIVGA